MNNYGRMSSSSTQDDVTGLAALRAAQNILDQATNRYDFPSASSNTTNLLNASMGGGMSVNSTNSMGGRPGDGMEMLQNRRQQEDVARILANVQSKTGGPPTPPRDTSAYTDPNAYGVRPGGGGGASSAANSYASYKRPFPFDTSDSYAR